MAPAPFVSLEKTWLRSRPGHTPAHSRWGTLSTLSHRHRHRHTHSLAAERQTKAFPLNKWANTWTYIRTKRVISTPTCFAHSCANDFQHIYNYCKCVQNFRPYTHTNALSLFVLHIYIVCVGVSHKAMAAAAVWVCAKWTFDFTGCCFCRFFTTTTGGGGGLKRTSLTLSLSRPLGHLNSRCVWSFF